MREHSNSKGTFRKISFFALANLRHSADAAYLLVNDLDECGIATFNDQVNPLGVGKGTCNTMAFTFGNGMGHIFGGQPNGVNNQDFPHGLGYLIQPTNNDAEKGN